MPDFDAARELRNALGTFATGITVVTTVDNQNNPAGMTVNSFTSVSLEPPLILWCLGQDSTLCELFRSCTHFNVNILGSEQESVSQLFASPMDDKFTQTQWHADERGIPVIGNSLATFQCSTEHRYPGGDHTIIVGRVVNYSHREGKPLLFSQGGYQRLQEAP